MTKKYSVTINYLIPDPYGSPFLRKAGETIEATSVTIYPESGAARVDRVGGGQLFVGRNAYSTIEALPIAEPDAP